ncbi:peptidoglycan/LPS O-acetylase OafA/YrhL [Agromyces hippuratus]|uniref:Peptidoglycan/LPS O-acetylase OafA/YrhL n=1 Tax=Agromyces hippuratus TaxID=286438 RepID=A0A852WR95_9MICO|nr:acyltransferase [Agromyces hippuratus]NYG20466.1 peptidoglycan/LPS O-acetylase OafA/YrhL [Agromyces hippuratus]
MSISLDTDVARAAIAKRDLVVDLARVFCVLLVVVIHLLMIGVGMGVDGAIITSRPLEAQPWFAAATWAGQIMPLFFALGGFTALTAWRSLERRGGDQVDFVRGRVLRLARPALPLFLFFSVALGAATLAGVDAALLDTVATGVGSPLWFLGAFLLAQSFAPTMVRLHEIAPTRTMIVLFTGAVLVDGVRSATGIVEIGLVNLVFVWFFVQQLGFWYSDGWFRARRPVQLLGFVVLAFVALGGLVAAGWYSPDMLVNLNPPTVPLALLGVAQVSLLTLVHRPLAALMRGKRVQAGVFFLGARAMTIYLWHLPVIIAVAGIALLVPPLSPAPGSVAWWMTRLFVFVVVLALVLLVSMPLSRFETASTAIPEGLRRPDAAATWTAMALTLLPAFAVMQFFLDLPIALMGAVSLAIALWLLRSRRPQNA